MEPISWAERHTAGHVLLRALNAQEEQVIQELARIARRRYAEILRHLDELHDGSREPAELIAHERMLPTPAPARDGSGRFGAREQLREEIAEELAGGVINVGDDGDELADPDELARSYAIEAQEREAETFADELAAGYPQDGSIPGDPS